MRQIQRQKVSGKEIQKETYKNRLTILFHKIVLDFDNEDIEDDIDDIEEEINEEFPSDINEENELDYSPQFEDFGDDEIGEDESLDLEEYSSNISDTSFIKKRKFIVEVLWIDKTLHVLSLSGINQVSRNIDPLKHVALMTAAFLRIESAKFIAEKQASYIKENKPIKRLTQRELLSHLNDVVIKGADQKKFIIKNLTESNLERLLQTLYIKIPEKGIIPAKNFFSGKRSKLSNEEWRELVREFKMIKGINEIKTPKIELTREFRDFLIEKGIEFALPESDSSSSDHDRLRTLKNKLKEYGMV